MGDHSTSIFQDKPRQLLADYDPFAALWQGEKAIYPSEQSARWAVRSMRAQLLESDAIALLHNQLFVNVQKLKEVAEKCAIQQAHKRANFVRQRAARNSLAAE